MDDRDRRDRREVRDRGDHRGPGDHRDRPARAAWWRRVPRWAAVPLGAGLGLAGGLGYGLTAAPQYAATSYVIVVPQHGDSATALGFAQAYGRVVTGSAVLAGAQTTTGMAVSDLQSHVQAATSPDAPMISVTGTGSRGAVAADIANAVADSLTATGNRSAASTGVHLLLFSPAVAPTAPASPSAALSAAVGGSAGGLLGALVLLVRPRTSAGVPAAAAATGAALPGPAAQPVVRETV